MRLITNIRGCNGSGKSTVPLQMLEKSPRSSQIIQKIDGKPVVLGTLFPEFDCIALGKYTTKCGGMDSFKNNATTFRALYYILNMYPDHDIIMEGIMASTIKSTYLDLFTKIEAEYSDVRVIILSYLPPIEVCYERIQKRNGGKPIKEEMVLSKWQTVNRNAKYFKEQGLFSVAIDNSQTKEKDMLRKFLSYIEKTRDKLYLQF